MRRKPRGELRRLVDEDVARLCTRLSERRVLLETFGDEGEDGVGRRRGEVRNDGVHVGRLPAADHAVVAVPVTVDLRHEHEASAGGEETERVARGDDLLPARLLGRKVLRALRVEPRPEPLDRPLDLRPVAARDQVHGLQGVGHGRSLVLGRDGDAIPVRHRLASFRTLSRCH